MNNNIFSGRTTKDIELRFTQENKAVGRFTLAVDSGYGDNKTTSFFNCVAFGKTAESMEKYVKKGTKILIQAEARQSNYTDRDGNKRTSVYFIVRNWEFAESKAAEKNQQEPMPESDDFVNIPDDIQEELPFM